MGLFGRRRASAPATAPEPNPDDGDTDASRAFARAAERGDLDAAGRILDAHLADGTLEDPPLSLLDRAATIRLAIRESRLDDAAAALDAWDVPYGNSSLGNMFEPGGRAPLRALGICLIDYFDHPDAVRHGSYDRLMDDSLANVAKSSRLSGDPFFDRIYAPIKSQREINRHR